MDSLHANDSPAQPLYAQDGVNVLEGDDFSAFAAHVCAQTHQNSDYIEVKDFGRGHFRGPRGFRFRNLPEDCWYDVAPDGIGTKTAVITAASTHRNAARDVLAMTCGDITRWGGLPVLFSNVFDTATIGIQGDAVNRSMREAIIGLVEAAHRNKIVLYKGETAELGACVGSEDWDAKVKYNWAGFALGLYHPERIITGSTLAPGQVVMALREYGFRSNGFSAVRKALAIRFGREWWNVGDARKAVESAAAPSELYDFFLSTANGWGSPPHTLRVKMHLIAHLTGGSIKSKLGEDVLFPLGLSADLDDLWEPPAIMQACAEWRGFSGEELYSTWNGGQGALVVIDASDEAKFIQYASGMGIHAKRCGRIVDLPHPSITIKSRFNSGGTVEYFGAE